MNKQDYLGWREHPITREFMEVVVKELNDVVADLVNYAGDNTLQDVRRRGTIEGLKWLLEWVPTVEDDNEEEEDDAFASTGSQDSD